MLLTRSFSNQVLDDLDVPVCQKTLTDYISIAGEPTPTEVKTDEEENNTMNAEEPDIHTQDTDSESTINEAGTEKSYDVRSDVGRDYRDGSRVVESEPIPDMSSSPVHVQNKGPQARRSLRNTPERSISNLVHTPDTMRRLRSVLLSFSFGKFQFYYWSVAEF